MGGKGKGKTDGQKGGGHLLPRTRITAEKFTGHILVWKGKYGFIKPAEEVEHEKAQNHGGKLFFGADDLEGIDGESMTAGLPCEFHIWEDETGLGADEVAVTGDVDPEFEIPAKGAGKDAAQKGASKGVTAAKGCGKNAPSKGWGGVVPPGKGAVKGASAGWGGVVPPGKGVAKGAKGAWPVMNGFQKGAQAGFDKGKGGKDKGKGDKGGKGGGHKLPRTRITAEKFTGTVKTWKGKYGWIVPTEEIEHELASKHSGMLFTGHTELEGGITELTEGAQVEFHIWEDSSGLGADEVVQL